MSYLIARAYFDQYGTFEHIDQTIFGDKLKEEAKKEKISITEYCCRSVGYIADNVYTAEERMIRRSLAVDEKDPEFKKLFPAGRIRKVMLKANNIQPFFFKNTPVVDPKLKDVVETVTNFIEHTEMIALIDKQSGLVKPLREMFLELKITKNTAHLDALIPKYINIVMMMLQNAKIAENIDYSYAAAGKLVLAHKPVDFEDIAKNVCLHIARRAMTIPADQYKFLIDNISHYQFTDPLKSTSYLKMVDLASINKMTVMQLIHYAGFSYVDQFTIFKTTGYFVYELLGSRYICINPYTPDEYFETTHADLQKLYKQDGGI